MFSLFLKFQCDKCKLKTYFISKIISITYSLLCSCRYPQQRKVKYKKIGVGIGWVNLPTITIILPLTVNVTIFYDFIVKSHFLPAVILPPILMMVANLLLIKNCKKNDLNRIASSR